MMHLGNQCLDCQSCAAGIRSVFVGLQDEEYDHIEGIVTSANFNKNDSLPRKIANKSGFYCVASGHVSLENQVGSGRRAVIRICGPGDLAGFDPSHGDSTLSIVALSKVRACFIAFDDFDVVRRQSVKVTNALIDKMLEIDRLKVERISYLENYSVKNRVAACLLSLQKKFGVESSKGIRIELNVDRRVLSSLSGTCKETLSRTLAEFQKDNIIVKEKNLISILDKPKLEHIAAS